MAVKRVNNLDTLPPQAAETAIGYGYSAIMGQLMNDLDRPIKNNDQYRQYYKQMLEEDETIGTGLEYLAGRVLAKIGEYTHPDERIKELVLRCFERIRGTMTDSRKQILVNSFAYGFAVAEFTVVNENGQWILSSLPSYDPLSLEFKLKKREDNSLGIGTVLQKVPGMFGDGLEIPAQKCLIKTFGGGGTPYGQPLLRRCYRWWAFKKALPKLWAVALERFGMPMIHAMASDKKSIKDLDVALSNINSKSYIVTDEKTALNSITSIGGAGIGAGFEIADALCDKKIYRSMFLPSLLVAGEDGGSYSLGRVHMELFNSATAALAEEYIDAELEQLWRPIIEWNFGPQEDYGDFPITDSMPLEDKQSMSTMFLNLANAGMLDPESDLGWMREMLGLPEAEEGAVMPRWQLENSKQAQNNSANEPGLPLPAKT